MKKYWVILCVLALVAVLRWGVNAAPAPPKPAKPPASAPGSQDFSRDTVGMEPAGWQHPKGDVGVWKVGQDPKSGKRVLIGTGPMDDVKLGHKYSFFLLKQPAVDSDISVRFRVIGHNAERKNAMAGIAFRWHNEDDYYWARLEWKYGKPQTSLLYCLQGVNEIIKIENRTFPFTFPTPWHTMRARLVGDKMTYWLDDKIVFDGEHGLFRGKGLMGLMVGYGSVVEFADFKGVSLGGKPAVAQGKSYDTSAGWKAETIVTGPHRQASLAIDSKSVPHVAVYDRTKAAYLHYWRKGEGTAWSSETIDDGSQWQVKYLSHILPPPLTALQIGPNDAPQVLYVRTSEDAGRNRDIGTPVYARKVGDSWLLELADEGDHTALHPTLSLQEDGTPQVFYADMRTRQVRHAWREHSVALPPKPREPGPPPQEWKGEDVALSKDLTYTLNYRLTSAVAPDDTLYAAWVEGGNLKRMPLAIGKNGKFTLTYEEPDRLPLPRPRFPDEPAEGCEYPCMARDAQGNVHISHFDDNQQLLMYSLFEKGKWTTEVVDMSASVGMLSSIAVMTVNNATEVNIVYCDMTHGTLKYARKIGTGPWQIEDTGLHGIYPSLSLDIDGKPRVVFWDLTAGSLRYAAKEKFAPPPH